MYNLFLDSKKYIPHEQEKWHYLDPSNTEQGPFETKQMILWFQNGFFKPDLRVRYASTNVFTTLGIFILLQKIIQ